MGGRKKRRPACNEQDRGSSFAPHESGQTSVWSFITRELVKPSQEEKQMTAELALAGASYHDPVDWHARMKQVGANGFYY